MSKINNSGPAFPGVQGVDGYGNQVPIPGPNGEIVWANLNQGMSLRAWLMGTAMQGLLHGSGYGAELKRIFDTDTRIASAGPMRETPQQYTMRIALSLADAGIAELEKK